MYYSVSNCDRDSHKIMPYLFLGHSSHVQQTSRGGTRNLILMQLGMAEKMQK